MTRGVSVVLVGIGGYGNLYVEALLNEGQERGVKIAGAVDPDPRKCNYWIRGLHGWKAWQKH
jgi:predicted dehydrogenase